VTDGPVLQGEHVVLRRATRAEVPRFAAILASPEVSRWWGTPLSGEALSRELLEEDAVAYAIEIDGEVAGMIQYHEENEPNYRSAGIDIFLAPDRHGHGLGADAVRTMARYLFEQRGHHRLTIDPAAGNAQAIAAYGKVGFKPVGLMRQYERGPDGTWHDGLLMDLLRDEFR
jgi:aminoglycoside 6'-N-acetyltransferase